MPVRPRRRELCPPLPSRLILSADSAQEPVLRLGTSALLTFSPAPDSQESVLPLKVKERSCANSVLLPRLPTTPAFGSFFFIIYPPYHLSPSTRPASATECPPLRGGGVPPFLRSPPLLSRVGFSTISLLTKIVSWASTFLLFPSLCPHALDFTFWIESTHAVLRREPRSRCCYSPFFSLPRFKKGGFARRRSPMLVSKRESRLRDIFE